MQKILPKGQQSQVGDKRVLAKPDLTAPLDQATVSAVTADSSLELSSVSAEVETSGEVVCTPVTGLREAFQKRKKKNVNFFQKGGRGSTPKFTFLKLDF